MAVEAKRGCGYRKVGGLYLVSGGAGVPCDRLPLPLSVCPVCSHGFKQSRGFTWTDVFGLVGGAHEGCRDLSPCPLCHDPKSIGKAGLLWVGEKFYKTPGAFQAEGTALGFSRRIKTLPRGFKVGETWVLLAHPKTVQGDCPTCNGAGFADGIQRGFILGTSDPADFPPQCVPCAGTGRTAQPGVFTLWRPERVEKILPESKRDSEEVQELVERGITPVFVPDNDKDHQGTVYDADEEEEVQPDMVGAEASANSTSLVQ